ncbi:MAG: hypothetical protein RLZZ283_607 [Candidatus Parcubacteria bacterium]|jgi:hypothetical protein
MSKTNLLIVAALVIVLIGLVAANYYKSAGVDEIPFDELTQCLEACKTTHPDQSGDAYQACLTDCGTNVGELVQ